MDINGNPTNNIYGIPANQYLDVESYIYTTGVKDSAEGRTLYGWKPNIRAVLGTGSQKGKLAENGKIMSGASVTEDTGIYATFDTGQIFGSTEKYVLIVPSDITRIGTGSAAFVYGGKSYYQDYLSGTTTPSGEAYTDFGCFIYSGAIAHYDEPYFWQPRERLAGIYFPDDSRLTTIDGATYTGNPTDSTAWGTSNRTFKKLSGKGAFERCDSLRFLILPNELTSIGKHAFFSCNGIVDMNIPKKVTTIGAYAFGSCTSIRVLPRPATGGNIDSTAYSGCSFVDENTIYIMGGAPTLDADGNKVYDNGLSGFIFQKNGSSWEAKGLSGETGEDKNKVFIFPDSSDFSATSDRRRAVEYDYIDRDGIKTKNSFPDGGVTSYKVGNGFASGKWCQNIIMPKAVTEIGDNAFFKSHVKYLETYATKIGTGAFTESENKEGDDSGNQWYYFHQPAGNPTYSIPNDAFVTPNNGVTRHLVFENKSMMDNVGSTFTGLSNLAPTGTKTHYQIPVYANIYSEEATTLNEEGVTLVESDLADRFYYDSDYVELPNIKQGNNTILYTKRLSGFDFASTKQATGGWVNVGEGTKHAKPTISHMDSTVWYTNTSYTASTTASDLYSIAMTTPVNIYTKNIAKPQNIYNKTYDGEYKGKYTFGETYTFGGVSKKLGDADSECIDYNTALGLSADYTVNLEKFTYANGVAGRTDNTSSLHNAGTYEFSIELNTKWGVWSDKYTADNDGYFNASATIARKKLDFSGLDKVPLFVNANNNAALSGATTPIYKYNDGWYISQKAGEEPNDTKTVTNSFVYYTGSDITIKISGENNFSADASSSMLGDVGIISRNGLSFANSSEYTASFMFQVKYIPGTNNQYSNYIFDYGTDEETKYNNVTDTEKGLSITGKQDNFFRISKRWYIVNQTNMFVNAGTQTPYLPIEGDVHYADDITVNVPELLYGNAADKIDFAIDYVPVTGGRATAIAPRTTMGSAENALGYYINVSMPAGTYNLKLYGDAVSVNADGEVKSYPAISGEYTITVLPKEFDEATIDNIHNTMRGEQVANPSQAATELEKYINAYPLDNKKLHESVSASITSLNNTLASDRSKGGDNYWTTHDEYFDTEVTVGYNREGSGNTVYWNEGDTLGAIGTANTYTFYYSISAKNYATIGGADASDRQQRGFRTTLYTAVKLSEIYNRIVDLNDPYFKDVTYTGGTAQTRVPYSQYYKYEFTDEDYVNVGTRTVTLTLNNPTLAHWESDGNDYSEYLAVVDGGKSLRVNFNIVTADNGWNVMPQMSSWTFNGFDKEVNAITAGLKFNSTIKYALIPNTVADPLAVEWNDDTVDGVAYFTVNDSGMVDNATAAKLNALKPASYYLKFFVSEIYATDNETVNVNAYNDIARNNGGNPMVTVTIGKAVNRWTSTPNVMRWTFGDYNSETNLITAEALYPALLPKDENGNNIVGFAYTVGGAALTAAQSKFKFKVYDSTGADVTANLANLHAGTYKLATSMDESDYYTAIAETQMNFVVAQAVNIWTTTPQVVQWTWGEYSASKNIISAATKFSGADGVEGSTDNAILFSVLQVVNGTRVVVDNLEDFQIDENGNIIDSAAATAFAALHAGDYYLRATKKGNNDYTDITGGATTDIPFSVAQATAVWEITPNMTSWQYKSFVNDNFRGGEPKEIFINKNEPITYTIKRIDGKNFEFAGQSVKSYELLFNNDGLLDQSMYEAFALLHVGEYKITAVQDATNDYTELKSEIEFAVLKTSNTWETVTIVIGYTYGSFSNAYFTAGVPTLRESKNEDGTEALVEYTLTKDGDSQFTPIKFTTLAGAGFATLNAGTYTIDVSYAGTDDYGKLTDQIKFTVGKYINGWNPSPVLRGWSYKNFTSALFTAGVPTKAESVGGVTYVLTGGNLGESGLTLTVNSDGTLSQESIDALTVLAAGDYTLTATYAGTDNYDAITATSTFKVATIDNSWATRPSVRGWTYGSFDNTYFTAGVPTLNESKNQDGSAAVVQYTIDKNDDDNFTPIVFTALSDADFDKLNAGYYTLNVTYIGTDNYDELTAVLDFRVAPVSNSWDTQPVIAGFVYNQFDAANNFIAGVPHFPLSDKAVYYAIGTAAYANVTTLTDFENVAGKRFTVTDAAASVSAITTYIGGLGKGTYYYAVFVPSDNNYSYLFYTASFNISQTNNYWQNAAPPDIDGWTYGTFVESMFTSGTPIHGTTKYTVRIVVNGNVDETDSGIAKIGNVELKDMSYDDLKALLNGLNSGTYSLQATSGSTEDYAEARASKQFTVAKGNNDWAVAPSITGWKYDNTAKTPGNKGTAEYENAAITAKYYLTATDSNGNLVANTSKEFSSVKDAGSYAYVLTVADTTNYNGFTTTLFFTVEKDDNGWDISPAGSYNWTWGDDITSITANIVGAKAHDGEVSYSIVKTSGSGTYTARTDVSISELLETLPVGKYTITASVAPDDNHVALTPVEAYVEVFAAQLKIDTEPSCAGWTWGPDENKVFTDIAVTPAKGTDIVSKAYSLSTDGGESWYENPDADYAYLLNYLRSSDRKVGEYQVRIIVTCANHESVTRIVTFTIGNASFIWSGEQKDVEWAWNGSWTEADGGRDIPEWTATDCQGNAVALSYTVNGAPYADFDEVKEYLQSNDRNAGTYTVKVKAEHANHATAEKTFTVTVNVATNTWAPEPNAVYYFEYRSWENADWTGIVPPVAKFGTVSCVYHNASGDVTIANINTLIKSLSASSTPYRLTFTVPASAGQYTALSKDIEINIAGIGSTWSNQTDLLAVTGASNTAASYNFTYAANVFESIKTTVVFPIGNATAGNTTYSVYLGSSDTPEKTYYGLTDLLAYFSSERTAGMYKIVADYEPNDKSYATLQYTVTVNVAKAEVTWNERLEASYSLTYNSVDVPNPTANKAFATVTVAVKKSGTDAALDMKGMTLADFVKTLDVGTYTITATIAESDNYYVNGSRETTSVLYIGAIPNTWKDVTSDGKTIAATEWTDGYTWTFTRGETISVVLPESVIGAVKITFNNVETAYTDIDALNEYLNSGLASGRYSLRFEVAATENYNGLVSNCVLIIDKKSNEWKQPLVSVNTSGSVDTTTFTKPTANVDKMTVDDKDVDLRLFNIVKAGNPANSDWYTTSTFMSELGKLVNGTYTITVRIGGSTPTNALDDFKKALELYTADYEEISCSCTITLSPAVNAWITKLSNMNWTWGDTVSAELSEATHGNNTIVYTVSGNNREWTVRTSAYNENIEQRTLAELNNVLGGLLPGTYTITASIAGTDLYAAPAESNFALLTVSKYVASWNTDEDLDEYRLPQMTWQQAQNDLLPELTVKFRDKYGRDTVSGTSAVVWKIGNETLTESVITALNKRIAGTYTVTATYGGDAYNEGLTFTAMVTVKKVDVVWSETTESADRQYNWVLNAENNGTLVQPTLENAGNCTVTFTLVKVGSAGTLYSGKDWTGTNSLIGTLSAQKAGSYEITAKASGDENYILPADVTYTLTISAEPNEWTIKPAAEMTWTYNDADNTPVVFMHKHINVDPEDEDAYKAALNKTIIVTMNGQTLQYTRLMDQLKFNHVGEYYIVAYVPATEEYAGLEPYTVKLTINQASDAFGACNVPTSWDWDDVNQKTDENGVAWQTTWNTALKVPVPQVSDIATVTVCKGTTEQFAATLHYETVDGVKNVLTTDLNALKSRLLGLHVGTYTIEFTVAKTVDYTGCSVVKTFEVLKVDNSWDGSDGVPTIAGWQYNSSVANPTATPVFGKGTVKFSYAQAVGDETEADLKNNDSILTWKDSTETTGGTYWLRAYVPGTDDYNALVGYHQFNINASQNGWVNNPGVIAWDWNGYNKTVNLFSGSAKNNGTATFKIYYGVSSNNRNLALSDFAANGVTLDKSEAWIISQFCTTGFTLVNENNVMVVSDDVAKYLNALKPGTYLLSVNVAGDNNYAALSGNATFVVKQTANGWQENKAPAVSSYTYGNFGNSTYFTAGETVYGAKEAVTYKLEGTAYDGTTVSETFVSSDSKGAYVKLQERLATLDAGTYNLSAWVAGSSNGTYSALYSSVSPYTTRSFTVVRATNSWKNTQLVMQINKAYSEIHATDFDATAFAALYAELLHHNPDATVNYALLNSDYSSRNTDSVTYAQLFDAIKALPAGEYVIRATVAQTNNYLAIAPTDTRLTISKHDNEFTQIPAALTAQWARDNDKNNAPVLADFEVKAKYGEGTVTYTLGTETYNTYSSFKAAVKALNAGPYNVTITIAGTDEYVGLSEVRMLTVNPADNNWQNGWNVDGSLSVADATTRANLNWSWNSTVTWTRAVPLYGNTVHVEIRQLLTETDEWYTVQYVTVDYSASNGDSAVAVISEALSKLDVGNYEIIVSAPASGNWTEISNKTEFEVTKVTNNWVKTPYITGATANKWTYGATVVPGAEPKYGAVRYEYTTKSGGKLTTMPTKAGEYVIKFIVDGSNNYVGIDDSIAVKIEKANNRNFSVALGVNGWTWGAYDRESNLFKGTPEITDMENAPIKFSVGKGIGDSFAVLPDLAMFTLNANGLVERDSKVEAALRALTGGTSEQNNTTQYTLRIHVGETDNYNGFTFDSTFVVTGATNTWTKTPSIVTWAVNNWTSESLPSAAALYGAPAITITGESDGVVYFKGAYKNVEGRDELELVVELNNLNLAPAGYYEMRTTVGTVEGQYNIPLTANSRFKIDVKGAGEANYWEVIPNIDGWVANIDGLFNSPSGKPIRGLPNFVFYVRNEDGTRGQKVDEKLTDLVVKKGDKYEADIYIPVEPGSYIMVASSNGNPAAEGKPDALKEEEIYFTIGNRPLSFEEELRISTLLYLGERNDWANPTTKPSLDDAEITYVYTNKETGVSSKEMPTEAGVYTVTATLSAKYSQSISMSVDFTVKLSPNSWTAAPNIKDWSEENKGNMPTGAATVGSDQIIYTYANVNTPNKTSTKKPTTEGSYIMYADIIVEGYEPLHAEYRFTIEPAFDRQLVIAAIALAVIACLLAGVVIYFAIRRYKEN